MIRAIRISFYLILFCLVLDSHAQQELELRPNSWPFDKIEKGIVTKHIWESTIFEQTIRDYYVYVPAQYDGSVPAALMIFQDGHTYVKEDGDFRVPQVFDNLIAQEKMPVTIGLFINPGHDKNESAPENPCRSSNLSMEYDELSDKYARFLLQELIPELKKKYLISDDPRMRAICGISSGGICAFTAAWFHPDQFHKVLSHIGSFTDIRGGHNYPSLIRKSEKKPIKIFMQDGINDLDNKFGNWWLSNLQMEAALKFKDYDHKFVSDTGAHNGKHGGLILPQALTWLWSDVVPKRIESKLYHAEESRDPSVLFSGETMHLKEMTFTALSVPPHVQARSMIDPNHEQLVIVRSGWVQVSLQGQSKKLGPNSVIFLLPGEDVEIKSLDQSVELYHASYLARSPTDVSRGKTEGGSFMVDFEDLTFIEREKSGRRDYFRKATAMCSYYEMHVTTLKPGFKSHDPHVHKAEELIIMIHGETEEEIGNEKFQGTTGDIYFLGANVPHAIKNIGDQPCMYFAFQWY